MYLLISLSRERRHIQKAVVIVMMLSLMWFCHTQENGASPYTKHMKRCGHCYDVIFDVVLSQEDGVTPYTKHTKGCGHCYDVIYDVVLSQNSGATPYIKHTNGCGHCYDITYDVVLSQAGGVTLYTKHTKSCGHCYDVIYDVVLSQECGILYIHQTAVVIVMVLSMMCATNRWGRPVHQLTTVASAS